jgi:[ribosomal protein S5]-alanine N-acetyltransferase
MTSLPLRTSRLLLRDFTESDWQAVHEYDAHPEVVHFMLWGPNSEEHSRDFVNRNIAASQVTPRVGFELAVVEQQTSRLVGGAGLTVTPAHQKGFLGYCFHRDVWGRGYATEASREVMRFGFEDLALHRITTTCDVDNHASARVLEKLGMQQEGILRHDALLRDGSRRDHFVYGILADEWRKPA